MHKSWGNSIEFNEAADKMGVDVMRWLYCNHRPEKDLLFGYKLADETRRQFLIPLWNVYSFITTYASIDGWKPDASTEVEYQLLDRWILSRMQAVVEEVTRRLEVFEPNVAAHAVNKFMDDLSNWYLRRSRRRFWAKAGASLESDRDKNAAYTTLYKVMETLSRLLAPFVPFVTESMYQNLVRAIDPSAPESVHHCEFPEADPNFMNQELIDDMDLVLRLVSLGHAARNKSERKVRQPLAEVAFNVGLLSEREIVKRYKDLIGDELNVKKVRILDTASEAVEYRLKPLPKQLGQKYGSQFPAIRSAILKLEPQKFAEKLMDDKPVEISIDGEVFEILPDEIEVQIEAHEGFAAAAEGSYLAALVTALTPELELEGLAREVVRRVQDLRRQAELKVDDRIKVTYRASDRVNAAIDSNKEYLMEETLSVDINAVTEPQGDARAEHSFDGEEFIVALERV
jgi:isoleucyl-tRNA synthetase